MELDGDLGGVVCAFGLSGEAQVSHARTGVSWNPFGGRRDNRMDESGGNVEFGNCFGKFGEFNFGDKCVADIKGGL
jgi:hypothetical protein